MITTIRHTVLLNFNPVSRLLDMSCRVMRYGRVQNIICENEKKTLTL